MITTNMEGKILTALEVMNVSLLRIVTVMEELVAVERASSKRQGSKDIKESLSVFTEEMKVMLKAILTPQPLPEQTGGPVFRTPPMRHEVKMIHLNDYIHNKLQLEVDINKLLADRTWILAGITDYNIMFHRMVEIEIDVDAEFTKDGGKVNVQ